LEETACAAGGHQQSRAVELQRRIRRHREAIDAALEHGLSQGLIESTNTKLRLLHRLAFGFHSPQAFIALAMLASAATAPRYPAHRPPHNPQQRQESPNMQVTRERNPTSYVS
jgi:hypothetical protein